MNATATVFGGSGFIGRRIVEQLARAGWTVRVAVRHPERLAAREGVSGLRADIRDESAVAAAVSGAAAVVNAVSLYVEKSAGPSFREVHEDAAASLARRALESGAARFVLISGIGADANSPSRFIGARGRGEERVRAAFPGATIVRPSVMFGNDDRFLNSLADILRRSPVFPLIGGNTRLQPVWADDVARAVLRMLARDAGRGETFELGGPEILTMRQIVEFLQATLRFHRAVVPVPVALALVEARLFELLPSPPLTVAQVELLSSDNVVSGRSPGFDALDIEPAAIEQIVPSYISRASR